MRNFVFKTLEVFSPVFNDFFKNRLRVLAYHDIVDPAKFEAQLIWLKSKYNVINIKTLKEHLFRSKQLPSNSLLITFDDGDFSVYKDGLPLLKKYKLPAALFIVTDLINSNKPFWWDRALKHYRSQELSEMEALEELKKLKTLPDSERTSILSQMPEMSSRQLKLEELKVLEKNGVEICNHSHTHPLLNMCSTEQIKEEINLSKQQLLEWKFEHADIFAYPNGNFDSRVEEILKENNFAMTFLFDHKLNESKIHPLRISRIKVDSDIGLYEFKVKISGFHPFLYNNILKKRNENFKNYK